MTKLKEILRRFKEFCFAWINALIPARVLIVKSKCKLRDDCKVEIRCMVVTPKLDFTDTEILDMLFKSHARHLKEKHNVQDFIGLQFKSSDLKYTIYLGEVEHG
jgi:hypothetical protein